MKRERDGRIISRKNEERERCWHNVGAGEMVRGWTDDKGEVEAREHYCLCV